VPKTEINRIVSLLRTMAEREASDLHLVPGYAPTYRVHGALRATDEPVLTPEAVRAMLEAVLPEPNRSRAISQKNLDCSLALEGEGAPCRLRINTFYAQGHLCACFRYVPDRVPTFEWMGFPTALAQRIAELRNGLVIVTGITGSGKTTTLAGLINLLIEEGRYRVITVEQPTEYVFSRTGTSMVTQREVGVDVDSFYDGLTYGLRQDPDVILVGEIRDPQTARMALSAAETGHLILSTLHTQDAKGAVTRLVDLFPHDAQDDVRSQLSLSLRYVICQHLLPSAHEGEKRALALEILRATHPLRAAIRFGKIESIENIIQTGRKDGMITLDESLAQLASASRISWKTAQRFAKDPSGLSDYVGPTRSR
jgi:twitching motility protein PilT